MKLFSWEFEDDLLYPILWVLLLLSFNLVFQDFKRTRVRIFNFEPDETLSWSKTRALGEYFGWLPWEELSTLKGLAELPVWRSCIVRDYRLAIAGCGHEGESLAIQNTALVLPVLSPVLLQWHPLVCLWAHDGHLLHIPGSSHICDQHQKEVRVAIDGEMHSSLSLTWYPACTPPGKTSAQ